jgi:hypothetical protein
MTLGRLSEIDRPDPVGLSGDELEVLLDGFGGDELAVRAHPKAEMILRGGYLGCKRQRRADTDSERKGGSSRKLHVSDDIKRPAA